MIYVFVPLYAEAAGLITQAGLVPAKSVGSLRCFAGNEIFLTVTGTGMSAMASATAAVLAVQGAGNGDIAVLYGSAAGLDKAEMGDLYRGGRVHDIISQRDSYPDLLTKTEIPVAYILSQDRIYDGHQELPEHLSLPLLYDMESSAFMQSCMLFLRVEQVCVLRFVSDDGSNIHPDVSLQDLSMRNADAVLQYMQDMATRVKPEMYVGMDLSSLVNDIHASNAMARRLEQIVHYCQCAGIRWQNVTDVLYENGILPCCDRQKGKKVLDEIEKKLCR